VQPQGRSEPGSAERRTEFHAILADERRFREWYDVAARRVYAYLFGRCGGEASLAEELTQLTFIDAIRHRETYDGRADSVTWLIAIGRNRLLDHLRRQEREERRRLRIVVREIAVGDGQEAAWETLEDRDQIVRAMRLLPANQRAALILHHVDGLPVREVAIAMQRSQTAVESLLSRGRERFRMVYEERHRG
jgi:RNA polymerase sigma-70 factor (ECF subfamily)